MQEKMYDDSSKIIKSGDSYTFYTCTSTWDSNKEMSMKFGSFSGTDTIWSFDVKKDTEVTFNYESNIDDGEFKVVLINPNKEIENILEGTVKDKNTIKVSKGEYRIKFVGKKAKGKINISIEDNKYIDIKDYSMWD